MQSQNDKKDLTEVNSSFLSIKLRNIPSLAVLESKLYKTCKMIQEHYRFMLHFILASDNPNANNNQADSSSDHPAYFGFTFYRIF